MAIYVMNAKYERNKPVTSRDQHSK